MTLLAHYLCDNQDNADLALYDVSGHVNNHDFPLSNIYNGNGFEHNRIDASDNVYSSGASNNPSDFRLQGEMTVCCWVSPQALTQGYVIGYGDPGETQAENTQWALEIYSSRFRLWWEHSAGVDQIADSPASALDPEGNGWGQTTCLHIACIRYGAATFDVKFVVNGVDLGADVTGLVLPDGGTYPNAAPSVFRENVGGSYLSAHVGSIRVYDTAESVATLLGIYNAEKDLYENNVKVGVPIFEKMGMWEIGGEDGSIYVPHHTGTSLAETGRGKAGWTEELA